MFFFNPAARVTDTDEPILDALVPDVVDLARRGALALIDANGLVATVIHEEASTESEGVVYSTTPISGTQVESGSEVQFLVNPPC